MQKSYVIESWFAENLFGVPQRDANLPYLSLILASLNARSLQIFPARNGRKLQILLMTVILRRFFMIYQKFLFELF